MLMSTVTIEPKTLLSALQTGNGYTLTKELSELKKEDLLKLLEEVCKEASSTENPIALIDRFTEVISLEQLEGATKEKYKEFEDTITSAKEMLSSAHYYLEKHECSLPPSLRSRLSSFLISCLAVLENILNAFGIADFFTPAESEMHSQMKGQKIMMLIGLFSILSAVLIPILGPALGGLIVGGTLLGIAALSLIYPYFRPAPTFLPLAQNWTQLCENGQLPVVGGRKGSVDEIAATLIGGKGVKMHPMLIGKSGVGKTETAKALVEAIARGEYPELAGKQVFYFNTADIVNNKEMFGGGNKILSQLSKAIGAHRHNMVFIFDEIHLACQDRETSVIADQLKTMLDPGNKDGFPYVIGITTEEEFARDIYHRHSAFARRFHRIPIASTTAEETEEILGTSLLRHGAHLIVEKGALTSLINKTEAAFANRAQPAASLKVLDGCIQKTGEAQKSDLEKKVEEAYKKLSFARAKGAVSLSAEKVDIKALEQQFEQLQNQLDEQNQQLNLFFAERGNLEKLKKEIFKTVVKVASLKSSNLSYSDQKAAKKLLFMSQFLAPAVEKKVREDAEALKVKTVLDEALIEEVIKQEQANEEEMKEAVKRGREALHSRQDHHEDHHR